MINGKHFRQALDKFFMSPVSGNARVQVQLPDGQMMDIKEIQKMINNCGFKILDDLVLPVEDKPMKEIVKNKITINYCAHIKKIDK